MTTTIATAGDNKQVEKPNRRKNWRGRRAEVLKYVQEVYAPTKAAILAAVDPNTVRTWIRTDRLFAQAVKEAQEIAVEKIEARHFEAAGLNDTLARLHILKSHKNETYGDKAAQKAGDSQGGTVNILQINTDPNLVAGALRILSQTGVGSRPEIDVTPKEDLTPPSSDDDAR